MDNNDIEKLRAGAPKIELEDEITQEVNSSFPFLSPEAKEAIINSRLNILNSQKPNLVRVDLGDNSSENFKDDLFE